MNAYKIRIVSEENEDFLREIEILGDQNFLDLHDFIVEICDLNGNDLASFYTCDNEWNKLTEISLMDMSIDEKNTDKDDDDENFLSLPMSVMENTLINKVIKKVDQKLLYEYDFLSPVTLFMQCVEINATESDEYPICLFEEGELDYKGGASENFDLQNLDDFDLDNDNLSFEDEIRDEFSDLMDDDYGDDMF